MFWKKATIIGVGLLGGSLGLAVKKRGLAGRVEGYVRRAASVKEAEGLGVVDRATCDLGEAAAGADLLVFCTPLGQMRELAERLRERLAPGCVITDVGSVKAPVAQQLEPIAESAGAHFIGSHPMAGSEKTGMQFARADLFEQSVTAVTPTARSDARALGKLIDFWKALGSRPLVLSPELHDEFVSRSSHLTHIVASELANYVLSPAHPNEQARLCANGFRDTTRIASSSPEMWRDIVLANRKNLARVLGVFIEDLQEFQLAVERGDARAVQEFFEQSKQRRDQWQAKQSVRDCGEE